MTALLPAWALFRREGQRFWGERSRVAGFVASPLLFWIVVGSGFGDMEYFFPGALTMTVMFSAMFSMMSLIEDRREGFFLSVLVSPASRLSIVLGKVLGATMLAWLQGLIVLACALFTRLQHDPVALAGAAGTLLLTALLLTTISYCIAWQMSSSQGFHAVINLLLVPAWMLSGAIFNPTLSFPWVRTLMQANPLYYAQGLVRHFLLPGVGLPEPSLALGVLLAGTLASLALAIRSTK
jgi:ABC-2 type transport system permease protein